MEEKKRQMWVGTSSQLYKRRKRKYMESRSRSTWAGTHPTRQKHRLWSRPRTKNARNEHRQLHQHTTNPVSKDHAQRNPLPFPYLLGKNRTYTPHAHRNIPTSQAQQKHNIAPPGQCLPVYSLVSEHTTQPTPTQRIPSNRALTYTPASSKTCLSLSFPATLTLHA